MLRRDVFDDGTDVIDDVTAAAPRERTHAESVCTRPRETDSYT